MCCVCVCLLWVCVCVMTDRWRALDCTEHICCIQLIHLISETFREGLRDVGVCVCVCVCAVGGRLHRPFPSCAGHGVASHRLRRNIQIWIWQGDTLTITCVHTHHTHTLMNTRVHVCEQHPCSFLFVNEFKSRSSSGSLLLNNEWVRCPNTQMVVVWHDCHFYEHKCSYL